MNNSWSTQIQNHNTLVRKTKYLSTICIDIKIKLVLFKLVQLGFGFNRFDIPNKNKQIIVVKDKKWDIENLYNKYNKYLKFLSKN